ERHPRRGSPARALREALCEAKAQGSKAQEERPNAGRLSGLGPITNPAPLRAQRGRTANGGEPLARGARPVSLRNRIQTDIAVAMRGGDALRRDTLRMATSAAYNVEKRNGHPLTEDELLAVL